MARLKSPTSNQVTKTRSASLILVGLSEHWGHIDKTLNPDLIDIGASYSHGRTVVVRRAGLIVASGDTLAVLDEYTPLVDGYRA